jgi:hypothetical protein
MAEGDTGKRHRTSPFTSFYDVIFASLKIAETIVFTGFCALNLFILKALFLKETIEGRLQKSQSITCSKTAK